MSDNWRISRVSTFEELRQRCPALDTQVGSSIFSTLDWFETLARFGFEPAQKPCLLLAENTATASIFCLPLAGNRNLHSLSNFYSSLFEPIGGLPDDPCCTLQKIFQSAGNPATIDLHPLDAESPALPVMVEALKAAGFWVDTYFCFANWVLDTSGRDFERYFAERPAQLRNNVRRGRHKLDREGPWEISISTGSGDESELEAAIAAFEAVYARSWKEAEPFPRFIGALCRIAAARGWLRLGILKLGETPVAAQLWLVHNQIAYIYKLAYDEQYRRLSAGSVLTAALMRHTIDIDRVTLVDYLTGDEAYKRDWMSRRRERVGIVAFRPTTVGGLMAASRHTLGKLSKRLHLRA
ncbi:MAG: GNAT family N-acetyltransferase [Betaproteobacteria bacterium]